MTRTSAAGRGPRRSRRRRTGAGPPARRRRRTPRRSARRPAGRSRRRSGARARARAGPAPRPAQPMSTKVLWRSHGNSRPAPCRIPGSAPVIARRGTGAAARVLVELFEEAPPTLRLVLGSPVCRPSVSRPRSGRGGRSSSRACRRGRSAWRDPGKGRSRACCGRLPSSALEHSQGDQRVEEVTRAAGCRPSRSRRPRHRAAGSCQLGEEAQLDRAQESLRGPEARSELHDRVRRGRACWGDAADLVSVLMDLHSRFCASGQTSERRAPPEYRPRYERRRFARAGDPRDRHRSRRCLSVQRAASDQGTRREGDGTCLPRRGARAALFRFVDVYRPAGLSTISLGISPRT